jgi:signal transduction histidine kinase
MFNFITNLESCYYGISDLIYYTHIPAASVAVLIGLFVFIKNKSLLSRILFSITVFFALWTISNLIVWVNPNSIIVTFVWSFFGILTALLFISCIYFVHVYITKKDVNLWAKSIWLLMLLPLIVFIKYAAPEFDLTYCEVAENFNYSSYIYLTGLISFLWVLVFSIYHYFKTKESNNKKQILYLTFGISAFLISFSIAGFLASYVGDFTLEEYGMFGMLIFMAYLSFMIVKFKAFNIKLIGAQALVWALIIVISSQFFFVRNNTNRILTAVTLVISAVVGLVIIRSVKKEIAQREHIERLAASLDASNEKLEKSNEKLKELDAMKSEFVSLATHQIRGPLAAIKGYISLIIEGDYGKVPEQLNEPLNTIFKSTDSLSKMVTDFLDVSRIDLGQMKYEFSNFDFKELVDDIVKELKPNIDARGLELRLKIIDSPCPIKADHTKLKQVLNNLIDNSSKYTKQGWLEVSTEKKEGKVLFAVKDSGVGISKATLTLLFQRFSRAKNANDSNILGTGLGLYIAKKMVEANDGKVWAESEGEGKGAQFYVELKLVE